MFRIILSGSRPLPMAAKTALKKAFTVPKFNSRLLSNIPQDPKAARIARMQNKGVGAKQAAGNRPPSTNVSAKSVITLLGLVATICSVYEINTNKDGDVYRLYKNSPLYDLVNWIHEKTWGNFKEVFYPANDKLLPDWPTAPCYGNPFPGTPAPPVLVLSLEKCLIGSVYDAKHGWRHVKRPGVEKFLEALQNYYEIVLFSETEKNNMIDVFDALDKTGHCHKFGSSEGEIRDNITLKRLDIMNRDVSRILLIDPSPEASALFPENTILIKPFEDIYDTSDRALLDLIPLLQGFVHEDVQDFRRALDILGTHKAQDLIEEYEMRISRKKQEEMERRNKGMGGVIRSRLVNAATSTPAVSTYKSEKDKAAEDAAANPGSKKKGFLFQRLDESDRIKEEAEMRKREKMNEIYGQRMREKAAEKEKAERQRQRESDM